MIIINPTERIEELKERYGEHIFRYLLHWKKISSRINDL